MVAGHGTLETGLGDAIRGCLVSKVGRTNHPEAVGVTPHRKFANYGFVAYQYLITIYISNMARGGGAQMAHLKITFN